MRLIANSSLRDYAEQFWERQREKLDPRDVTRFAQLEAGANPVDMLRSAYPFKLPKANNDSVSIALLTSATDIQNLIVHEYIPNDDWMRERNLVPEPLTRKLGDLAALCLERDYFRTVRNDRQIQHFVTWQARGTLFNALSPEDRPLIETVESDQFEIVDGWGRLLPFAALLIQGLSFEPFEVFLAHTGALKL